MKIMINYLSDNKETLFNKINMQGDNYKIIAVLLCFFLLSFGTNINAQKAQKAQKESVVPLVLSFNVVNEQGEPITNAIVYSALQRMPVELDNTGRVQIQTTVEDIFVIKAFGYKDVTLKVTDIEDKIVMTEEALFSGSQNLLYTPYSVTTERRTVGAYSKISGEELENNPTTSLYNSLGGRLNGFFQQQNFGTPGMSNQDIYVRGNWGGYITIVDGVERSADDLDPEVIESVQLLKDASLKAMYGGKQANGILVIKTKRGETNVNSSTVRTEFGVQMPTRLPNYLNSYDYAVNYNKAMMNAGADPLYDAFALDNYKNGTSPYLYPDVDFYDEMLNKSMYVRKVSVQSTGGNEMVRYFTHIGYESEGGLEKNVNYDNNRNAFFMRAAADMEVNDFISFDASFNATLEQRKASRMNSSSFFSTISGYHPNDFPLTVPKDLVGLPDLESDFVYGGTSEKQDNPLGMLSDYGYRNNNRSYVQSDFSMKFDFDKWVKGLSIVPFVSLDVDFSHDEVLGGSFAVYEPVAAISPLSGADTVIFSSWGINSLDNSAARQNASVRRVFAFNTNVNYNRVFGDNAISALLLFSQSKVEIGSVNEYPRRQNLALRLNYMYKNKYIIEAVANRTGVTSFRPENRYGIFPTIGAAWIVSEENFMSNSFLDYFKLRTSYGIIGSTTYTSEGAYSTHLDDDIYGVGARVTVDGSNENYVAGLDRVGNSNLGFQKSKEFNIGFDALVLDKSLWFTFGYFNNLNDDLIATGADEVPGVTGHNAALPWRNAQAYRLSGVEGEMKYTMGLGEFKMRIGGNFTYGISNVVRDPEPDYPTDGSFDGIIILDKPTDVIFGYEVIGTFQDEADIENSPIQTFGAVFPGDLKYNDRNDDGIVDDRDRTVIGNNSPRIQYGITLDLYYKGFNLNVLGVGYGGYERQLNNSYYQIFGTRKYSDIVIDGLPNGNPHPQLSIRDLDNNFVNSDYWSISGSYFKLRSVELGYTIPSGLTKKINITKCKVFTRGYNLFTISNIKKLDPENINAGINNYPLMTSVTAGLTVSF
jgi:TonB-linked SusC/RagA family outer membrane protein